MENWKERFEYIYVIEENKGEKYLRKYDHTTIVEELEYFISQELDKAREEGRKELLTQPQTEEETKLVMPPSAYEQAEKEGYDMRKKVKSELIPEDTPEQKEEWEKRFIRTFGYWGEEIKFIKQLLKEREKEAKIEVLTEIFQTCYQEDSKTLELVEEKLSKLKDNK